MLDSSLSIATHATYSFHTDSIRSYDWKDFQQQKNLFIPNKGTKRPDAFPWFHPASSLLFNRSYAMCFLSSKNRERRTLLTGNGVKTCAFCNRSYARLSQHRLARGIILLTSKSAFSRRRIFSVLLLGRDMSCLDAIMFQRIYWIRNKLINNTIA